MATRLVISGRVQGVFFRDWTVDTARGLGLSGWVRNRHDGTVEAHAEGDAAAIASLVQAAHRGPDRARVDRVQVSAVADEGCAGFHRRPTG